MLICGLVFGARRKNMCCKNFWKRAALFAVCFMLGLFSVKMLRGENTASKNQENVKLADKSAYTEKRGIGYSWCFGRNTNTTFEKSSPKDSYPKTENIKILSQPKPPYTDEARKNNVAGTVTLKVVFRADGRIGSVVPVSVLPHGLTEQAIEAAKQIRFEPKKVNGVPQSVSKTVTYTFTIY